MSAALVLAGAVAKGAFEAGAIEVLMERGVKCSRVVGASSGALNGLLLSSGIRSGQPLEAARRIVKLWREQADWQHAFSFSPGAMIRRQGLSDDQNLVKLLSGELQPVPPGTRRPVHYSVTVTALNGVEGRIGPRAATTYEKRLVFPETAFDSQEGIEGLIRGTLAAAAFPGVYVPENVEGVGPCSDGGIVNNTPIKYALESHDVDHVYVLVSSPENMGQPEGLTGLALLNHIIDALISERLYRDLRDAWQVNEKVEAFERLHSQGLLSIQALQAVLKVLSWRKAKVTVIRPAAPLPGNSFSGFFSREIRETYLAEGRKAAMAALGADGYLE